MNCIVEIISDIVYIDVHFMEPTDEEPFRVIYTTGMSDLPMILPDEFQKECEHLKRAELMLYLINDTSLSFVHLLIQAFLTFTPCGYSMG